MDSKKMVIGFNMALHTNAEEEAKNRRRLIAQVSAFFNQYELNPPLAEEFAKIDILQTFVSRYRETNGGLFPKHYSHQQVIEALQESGIDVHALKSYQKQWNALRLPFDYKTLTAAKVDCNIYAETPEEEKRFQDATNLLKHVNDFWNVYGKKGTSKAIKEISGGAIIFDIVTGAPIVNLNWIKKQYI
jgi:hypothetical protein